MSKSRGCQQNTFSLIIFIVTASNLICTAVGFGAFQIKLLSIKVDSPSHRCHNKEDRNNPSAPCSSDHHSPCNNSTLHIQACLSHHQLPVPLTLQCTLGEGELTLHDLHGDVRMLTPDSFITIPFSYSWPRGYSLSVSAYHKCPTDQSPAVMISNIILADHILPSRKWTSFLNTGQQTVHNKNHPRTTGKDRFSNKDKLSLLSNTNEHIDNMPSDSVSSDEASTTQMSRVPFHPQDKSKTFHGQNTDSAAETSHSSDEVHSPSFVSEGADTTTSAALGKRHNENVKGDGESQHSIIPQTASADERVIQSDAFRKRQKRKAAYVPDLTHSDDAEYISEEYSDDVGDNSLQTSDSENADAEDEFDVVLSTTAIVRMQGNFMVIAVRVKCKENYYGKSCSQLCRPRDDILGHYRCSKSGQHVCLQGWKGPDCTEAVCSESCLPTHGTCTHPYTCSCRHGWYGEHCEKCRTRRGCVHGTCHLPGQCICLRGWTGPLCDIEELFCLEHTPCQNGGTCLHDRHHNYTCACPAGYTGTHCEVPVCHDNFCLRGGECQVAEGTRYCLCQLPYAGPRCQHRLDSSQTKQPGFHCNGLSCFYRDKTFKRANTASQISCTGTSCDRQNSCHTLQCHNNGKCVVSKESGIPVCQCVHPYIGPQCLEIPDPCESNPCQNNGVCELIDEHTQSFECQCMLGYSGKVCEQEASDRQTDSKVCDEHITCFNGGSCVQSSRGGLFYCQCSSTFTGEFCEIDVADPCSTHTCLNRGQCVLDEQGQPACVCKMGYTGTLCQHRDGSLCSRVVCQNGGTCFEHDDEFVCVCRNRFEGLYCEKRYRRKKTTLRVRIKSTTRSMATRMKLNFYYIILLISGLLVSLVSSVS